MLNINIAVISGKGGTGKTLVATNLAPILKANYIDADVEEPNGFIFLKPKVIKTYKVKTSIPKIDQAKCQHCYKCIDFCEFNALATAQDKILVFDKLCHSCGGCKLVCEYDAISYQKKEIGHISIGTYKEIECRQGVLKIGELMAVSLIEELLSKLKNELNIIDSSPGTSCNVVSTLSYADSCLLITEPTQFGLHDLKRAVSLVREFKIPFGVIINRAMKGNDLIEKYCQTEKINVIGQIPYDVAIAKLYSEGKLLIEQEKYKKEFTKLGKIIKEFLLCNLQS